MPNALIRSFVAVELNNEQVLQNIIDVQQTILRTGTELKLVEPHNIHITLRFLGEISQERMQEIIEQMRNIRFSAFRAEFKGIGVFPGPHRPSVVWVGIDKGAKELSQIFETLEHRLRAIRVESDRRGFTPHLTIARVKSGRNRDELIRLVSELQEKQFGAIDVDNIVLKKSNLTPSGPIYTDLHKLEATPT